MANSDPRSSFDNDMLTDGYHNSMIAYLSDRLDAFRSNPGVALQPPDTGSASNTSFGASSVTAEKPYEHSTTKPPPTSSSQASYPPPFHGDEGSTLAKIFAHHYEFNFLPEVKNSSTQTNPEPPVVAGITPNDGNTPAPDHRSPSKNITELQRSLDDAIAIVHARQVPLLCTLETAGCHNWKQLLGHLSAIAWKHLAVEKLQPRSSEFWEGELTRLYCEYVRKGKQFEEVPIEMQLRNSLRVAHAVTRLDNEVFTTVLTTFLASDILREFISKLAFTGGSIAVERLRVADTAENLVWTRDVVRWRGDDEGYALFHGYENIPGRFVQQRPLYFNSPYPDMFLRYAFVPNTQDFLGVFEEVTGSDGLSYLQPLRRLNMGLVVFGCSVLLTCLEFIANRPRRKADNIWKNMTITNISHITQFFRKVITGGLADVSDDAAVKVQENLMRLATLEL